MSMDIGDIGLLLLLGLLCLQTLSASLRMYRWTQIATTLAFITGTCLFLRLIYAYVVSDFLLINVFENSHSAKPLLYKISGTWGNHEGSMLLFLWLLLTITALFAHFSHSKDKSAVLGVQGGLAFLITLYIFFTSSPFLLMSERPQEGMGLNPLLQDVGLAMHPPMLYIGYVGWSLAFSFAVVGLLKGSINRTWAEHLLPWLRASWAFLGIGIMLGSWWAYRELGWGGFWFWDPVENSSLLPWLSGTALLHSLSVTKKQGGFQRWTVLLCILSFTLSLTGFFLVRSGVLTSVHSFASDPGRGMFMLAIIAIISVGSLTLYAIKAPKLENSAVFSPISRESSLFWQNILMMTLCGLVFLGTIYPIILEVMQDTRVSVGAPFFQATFLPLTLPILLLATLGMLLRWKKDTAKRLAKQIQPNAIAMLCIAAALLLHLGGSFWLPALATALALLLLWHCIRLARQQYQTATGLTSAFLSMVLAHGGLAIVSIAIACYAVGNVEKEAVMKLQDTAEIADYTIRFEDIHITKQQNYLTRTAAFVIQQGDATLITLHPENRIYLSSGKRTTEAAIYYTLTHDLYIAMSDTDQEEALLVRVYYNPGVSWIWIGVLVMASGALLAAFKGRKR